MSSFFNVSLSLYLPFAGPLLFICFLNAPGVCVFERWAGGGRVARAICIPASLVKTVHSFRRYFTCFGFHWCKTLKPPCLLEQEAIAKSNALTTLAVTVGMTGSLKSAYESSRKRIRSSPPILRKTWRFNGGKQRQSHRQLRRRNDPLDRT